MKTLKTGLLCLLALTAFGSLARVATSAHASQAAPIVVIPMGETQPSAPSGLTASPSPVGGPYNCTMSQDDIRGRVEQALSFVHQGSYGKAQHSLQLLLEDLSP